MKSLISTKSRNILKRSLPNDGMQRIANQLGISLTTVSRALNGKNKSREKEVIEVALKIVEDEKLLTARLDERINQL